MNSDDNKSAVDAKAAAAEGRFTDALVLKLESLRHRASALLASLDMRIVESDPKPGESPPSKADIYEGAARAVEAELERLGDKSPVKLVAVKHIYRAMGNFMAEISSSGPVDGERVAKLLLIGMDIEAVNSFCGRLDGLADEDQRAALAESLLTTKAKQRAAADATNAGRVHWHEEAFVARAVFLNLNPGETQLAKRAVAAFVKDRTGIVLERDDALDKALQRKKGLYSTIERAVAATVVQGLGETAPAELRDTIAAALAAIGPAHRRA